MTFTVTDAWIDVFAPQNTTATPDYTIGAADIEAVTYSERINERRDSGTFLIDNSDGRWTAALSAGAPVDSGWRLEFWTRLAHDNGFGDGQFGYGTAFGGYHFRWTAMVRDIGYAEEGPARSLIEVSCDDLVSGVLSMRLIYDVWHDTRIAGTTATETGIVDELLAEQAPELPTDIGSIPTTTSFTADGAELFEALVDLARRGDAMFFADRGTFVFKELTDAIALFGYGAGGYGDGGYGSNAGIAPSDLQTLDVTVDDAEVVNQVRVDGGRAYSLNSEQPTKNGYHTVSGDAPLYFRVETWKSTLGKLEVWTRLTGSNESITVRLQKDDGSGGGPVDPTDESSDIASKTLGYDELFVDDDGYTTFIMPNHTLPEPDPWVIVQTDGQDGQDIGVDTTLDNGFGDPVAAHRAYYEYSITVQRSNFESRLQYRRRDARIKKTSIDTPDEAIALASASLNHDSVPEVTVRAGANTVRGFALRVGELVTLDHPRERVVGDYIVIERNESYDGSLIETEVVLQEIQSI